MAPICVLAELPIASTCCTQRIDAFSLSSHEWAPKRMHAGLQQHVLPATSTGHMTVVLEVELLSSNVSAHADTGFVVVMRMSQ